MSTSYGRESMSPGSLQSIWSEYARPLSRAISAPRIAGPLRAHSTRRMRSCSHAAGSTFSLSGSRALIMTSGESALSAASCHTARTACVGVNPAFAKAVSPACFRDASIRALTCDVLRAVAAVAETALLLPCGRLNFHPIMVERLDYDIGGIRIVSGQLQHGSYRLRGREPGVRQSGIACMLQGCLDPRIDLRCLEGGSCSCRNHGASFPQLRLSRLQHTLHCKAYKA